MASAYPFTQQEFEEASRAWGANCGPGALAFACRCSLDEVRKAIPDFEARRYTSPTMMKAAIANLGRRFIERRFDPREYPGKCALARIQWTGPWTALGANPKWAYRQTHWIAIWCPHPQDDRQFVFDINGGIMLLERWKKEIVPSLTAQTPRADGGWTHTHVWQLLPREAEIRGGA